MPALLPASGPFCGSPHQQQLDTLSPSASSSSPSSPQPSGSKRGRKKTKPDKPAANEHLPPRTSCDSCRTRKLKCDGRSMADGGCERCSREQTACHYSIRAPIGRPKGSVCPVKKRKIARDSDEKPASPSVVEVIPSSSPFQPTSGGYALSPPSAMQPFAALQYAVDQQHRQQQQSCAAGSDDASLARGYSDAGPQAYYRVPVDELHGPLYSGSYPSVTSNTPPPAIPHTSGISLNTQQSMSSFASSSTSHGHLMDSPLATLEMAAFLDSLDRVEIKPADGLTANMLPKGQMRSKQTGMPYQQLQRPTSLLGQDSLGNDGMPVYSQAALDASPFASSHQTSYQGSQSYPNQNQVSILDEGVSYAVPSDFSWWDLGLDANLMGGAGTSGVSKEATNAAVDSAHIRPQENTWTNEELNGNLQQDPPSVAHTTGKPHTSSLPEQSQSGKAAGKGSCCSKKAAREEQATPPSQILAPPIVKSCCSKSVDDEELKENSEATVPDGEKTSRPCPKTGAANCCCDCREQLQSEPEKQATEGSFSSDDDFIPTVNATTSKETSMSNTHTEPRVHCVPNPSGTGCTCLCESSVCLLGVRRTLGHPLPISSSSYEDDLDATADGDGSQLQSDRKTPIPSLHLTLSASRAISDSCACSASCPTCCGAAAGSETGSASASTHAAFNASLLISLALQIYARAVRILRDGFSSSASTTGGDTAGAASGSGSGSGSSSVDGVVGGLEIKIGGYRPSKENARRIALLAIRLELSDLEKGMGRVYKMAVGGEEGNGRQAPDGGEVRTDIVKREVGRDSGSEGRPNAAAEGASVVAAGADKPIQTRRLLAPVDGLVICKLREQLREMISRVEALERL